MEDVLFAGFSSSGSWLIRGVQIATALSSPHRCRPERSEFRDKKVAVFVKRVPSEYIDTARLSKARVVWDCVDAWPQPVGNSWTKAEALAWLKSELSRIKPDVAIGATEAMAADIASLGYASTCVPHHYNPAIMQQPLSKCIERVGYEGGAQYIKRWGVQVSRLCDSRGWKFVISDGKRCRVSEFDAVVALRDADGYAPRHWKSNVKLANAMAAGVPFIGSPECGYQETSCGVEYWAASPAQLNAAMSWIESVSAREHIRQKFTEAAKKYSLKSVASRMRSIIDALR